MIRALSGIDDYIYFRYAFITKCKRLQHYLSCTDFFEGVFFENGFAKGSFWIGRHLLQIDKSRRNGE
ncbi:hypothetical protein HFA01_19030 [Halobacillus faecis]|uniref:Uncharacterized protein n=1 Tax=Halobacillus faecis TaxID=360184 RepID=A0A511WTE0_9BACI|nr:hypothetical protein HFA01_19030 [Halobacillus faecis]